MRFFVFFRCSNQTAHAHVSCANIPTAPTPTKHGNSPRSPPLQSARATQHTTRHATDDHAYDVSNGTPELLAPLSSSISHQCGLRKQHALTASKSNSGLVRAESGWWGWLVHAQARTRSQHAAARRSCAPRNAWRGRSPRRVVKYRGCRCARRFGHQRWWHRLCRVCQAPQPSIGRRRMSKDDCGPQNAAGGGGGGSGSQKRGGGGGGGGGHGVGRGVGGEAANEEERAREASLRFPAASGSSASRRSRRTGRQRSLGFCTMEISQISLRRSLSPGHPRAARRRPLTGVMSAAQRLDERRRLPDQ